MTLKKETELAERICDEFRDLSVETQNTCMRRLRVINAHAGSETGLYMKIEEAVTVAAAVKRTGEGMLKPLEDIEDEPLFEWALGYYKALLKTADEYESNNTLVN